MQVVNDTIKKQQAFLMCVNCGAKMQGSKGAFSQPSSSLLITQSISSNVQTAHCILHTYGSCIFQDM